MTKNLDIIHKIGSLLHVDFGAILNVMNLIDEDKFAQQTEYEAYLFDDQTLQLFYKFLQTEYFLNFIMSRCNIFRYQRDDNFVIFLHFILSHIENSEVKDPANTIDYYFYHFTFLTTREE